MHRNGSGTGGFQDTRGGIKHVSYSTTYRWIGTEYAQSSIPNGEVRIGDVIVMMALDESSLHPAGSLKQPLVGGRRGGVPHEHCSGADDESGCCRFDTPAYLPVADVVCATLVEAGQCLVCFAPWSSEA